MANNTVLFNGEDEKRRGKKLRYGDVITIPSEELEITIVAPTTNEIEEHQKEVAEKARVAAIVKKMNQDNKKKQKAHPDRIWHWPNAGSKTLLGCAFLYDFL